VGTEGMAGAATTAGRTLRALGFPGLNFGPGPTAAGAGVARETVSAESESGASGAKATEAIPPAGASPDGALAAAGAVSFCARTILGAEQMMAAVKSAAADVMNASHVFARRGDVFLCVLSIISILCFS